MGLKNERPQKPKWLSGYASEVWDRTIRNLETVDNLLSLVDGDLLSVYCEAWATYHDATQVIKSEGLCATGSNGSIYQHPAVGIRNKAADRIAAIAKQFGMSPEGRKRLSVHVADAYDPIEEFLA